MKWCYNHKSNLQDIDFYPDSPEKGLCIQCIKGRIKKRNSNLVSKAEENKREQNAIRTLVSKLQPIGEHYIYLVEHEGRYKIGTSKNINKRVQTFNTSHAIPCKIIAIAPGDHSVEKELHKQFSEYRLNGEWFVRKLAIFDKFKTLPNVYIFLQGYIKSEANTPPSDTGSSETVTQ